MNWDERARKWANCFMAPVPLPKEEGELRDNGIKINIAAKSERAGFETGARWQRHQLRDKKQVERMAKTLYEQSSAAKWNGLTWEELPEDQRDEIKKSAKIAINALLGEN